MLGEARFPSGHAVRRHSCPKEVPPGLCPAGSRAAPAAGRPCTRPGARRSTAALIAGCSYVQSMRCSSPSGPTAVGRLSKHLRPGGLVHEQGEGWPGSGAPRGSLRSGAARAEAELGPAPAGGRCSWC